MKPQCGTTDVERTPDGSRLKPCKRKAKYQINRDDGYTMYLCSKHVKPYRQHTKLRRL